LCPLMFFNNTSTPASYRLSLHDALPISGTAADCRAAGGPSPFLRGPGVDGQQVSARSSHAGIQPLLGAARARIETHRRLPRRFGDRKSTRLNSSHVKISYAVFCLKKKKK